MKINILGGGLAGCEAAWALANRGIPVTLYEMKPHRFSDAHKSDALAELVCSNSLKAQRLETAAGMLKAEMKLLGSLCIAAAEQTAVPAGGALAVDRQLFSQTVTQRIAQHPKIELVRKEVTALPEGFTIIATGPLTSDALVASMKPLFSQELLSFFDAAAPIIERDSIDFTKAFAAARYGRGGDDYINCPLDQAQYEQFYKELTAAKRVELKAFEHEGLKVYEGCMPVEVLASRGMDTLRFGPMKPVGLRDPATGHRPWAVLQLRNENAQGSLLNMVGFQTNLTFGEQKRVFSLIPGLENASFVRYGVMHRNTFIDSPRLLTKALHLKTNPQLYFAGQITGVEGYMESAACGMAAALSLYGTLTGKGAFTFPRESMTGALLSYITDESVRDFQPMGSNMGILPPLDTHIRDKRERYEALAKRGLQALEHAATAFGIPTNH